MEDPVMEFSGTWNSLPFASRPFCQTNASVTHIKNPNPRYNVHAHPLLLTKITLKGGQATPHPKGN